MSANTKRKREFLEQLSDRREITVRDQPDQRVGAWKIETSTAEKVVWLHFNKYHHMWTGSDSAAAKVTEGQELIHAFLGPERDQYYLVPHSDLQSEFTLYDKDDGKGWVLNAAGEAVATKENAQLLSDYRSFEVF